MKYEWKKEEKEIYSPGKTPSLVQIPSAKYFSIKGKGDPNGDDFAKRVSVLYSLAYAVRMMPKKGFTPEGYFEYTVYPLEGVWDLSEEGKKSNKLDKDQFIYKISIKQPSFITQDVVNRAFEIARKKEDAELLSQAFYEEVEDGLSVQMLHIGSYDNEPASFSLMKDYINNHNLEIREQAHKEIYLSDARKTETEKLQTILRYKVQRKN